MTLVLTEISPFGIAMAADSAVTFINRQTGATFVRPNLAHKLQSIAYLNAGISCWGMGSIGSTDTDKWISDFIANNSAISNPGDFAQHLADELNALLTPNTTGQNRIGFHLAGYEEFNGSPAPSFFNIHDGPSTVLASRGITIDPNRVNANHDMPPSIFSPILQSGQGWITRNGDYQLYASIFQQ